MNSQFEKMCPDSKRCQKPTYKYYIFVLGVHSEKGEVFYTDEIIESVMIYDTPEEVSRW